MHIQHAHAHVNVTCTCTCTCTCTFWMLPCCIICCACACTCRILADIILADMHTHTYICRLILCMSANPAVTTKRALKPSSESDTRFATSVTRAYTLMMRFSRRALGSSRCARDSKTPLSSALTSGRSGCWKPSPPLHQATVPGCNISRRESEPPLSRARSKGSFPPCKGRQLWWKRAREESAVPA